MLSNEDAFQARVMEEHIYRLHRSRGETIVPYAKVTHMGGNATISEIDLIIVSMKQKAYAYEFKFLRGKNASYNYGRVYKGLGQALFYFWYGFDQSTLCVGLSNEIKENTREKVIRKLKQACSIVDRIGASMPHFGFAVFTDEEPKLGTFRFLPACGSLPVVSGPMQQDRKSILRGDIKTRGNAFLIRYGLSID